MKAKTILLFFTIGLFTALFTFICSSNTVSAKISSNDFNDGISGWLPSVYPQSSFLSNRISQINIGTNSNTGSNLKLGYAFGLAQDKNGIVKTMGDDTITKTSVASGSNNIQYSKMNVFLNSNNNYISSIFQSSYALLDPRDNIANVSLTSPDFMLVPSNTKNKAITAKAFSILGTGSKNDSTGNVGMTNKQFYYAKLSSGAEAYKIMGNFTRTNTSNNGNYNLEVELLLRPSPTNSAIVQRELYVKNLDENTTTPFTILFGEDTKLGASGGGNDKVLINNLGNTNGIYIEDSYSGGEYKLLVTNLMPDGFTSYSGQEYNSNTMNWASGFSDKTIAGTGAEYSFKGDNLLGQDRKGDSSYTLKWDSTTLKKNEVAHYGSTMGVTAKPFSTPTPEITYENITKGRNATNLVGDKLKFHLKITNNGYGAKWKFTHLINELPNGLIIDPKTITLSKNNNNVQVLNPNNYNSEKNSLNISPAMELTDTEYATVNFEAQITKDALSLYDIENTIKTTAGFTGIDVGNKEKDPKTYSASADIKVKASNYSYTFTKLVKKDTDKDYKTSINAKAGDIIDYQIIYTVDKGLLSRGATIDDCLPPGLQFNVHSVTIWGPGDLDNSIGYPQDYINTGSINPMSKGQRVKIQFSATVTSSAVGRITNNATITNVNGDSFNSQISTGADVNIQKVNAITEIPSLINFGTTMTSNHDKLLTNISTEGHLLATHPDSNPYNICVAYEKQSIFPKSPSTLLYIRQRTSKSEDSGKWVPVTKTGTNIQSSNFNIYKNDIDLTSYIGAGDWHLKLAANTPSGYYEGKLTWSLIESI